MNLVIKLGKEVKLMEENIYQIIKNQEINFLKEELDRIKKQIKDYKYKDSKDNFEGMIELWKLRKSIVEEIGVEIHDQEINFLKEELDRIKKQIKDYKYKDSKDNFEGMIELWKLRKSIVEEINEMTPPQIHFT